MTIEQHFNLVSNAFLVGWLCLFISIFIRANSRYRAHLMVLGGRVIPLLLLALFVTKLFTSSGLEPKGNFFTSDGVIAIFAREERTMNIWGELLAYMLLISHGMLVSIRRHSVPKAVEVLMMLAAFVSISFGIVVYLVTLLVKLCVARLKRDRVAIAE